ncbi:hypothetical protein DUI87_08019 [Hirundo rustica rustica]|uniref:Uncharacterized protein n=1 Tax=Hirundo rustica rustica TaxID=333673 RepID=A0A3M0KRK3_HIRRU|nr:hypothetical protein DUI87_08019 [Hirundo rustica rustica]
MSESSQAQLQRQDILVEDIAPENNSEEELNLSSEADLQNSFFTNSMKSNTESGIECKFADDTKVCGLVDTLEGRNVIWMDIDRLQRWQDFEQHEGYRDGCFYKRSGVFSQTQLVSAFSTMDPQQEKGRLLAICAFPLA